MSNEPGPRPGDRKKRLDDLEQRIAAARKSGEPAPREDKDKYAAMSMAWRITIELAVSIAVGAAMGWGLDSLLGTLPAFLVVFTLLGFAAGVRTMMRSVQEDQRRKAAQAADDE
ncbi:MAG: AtpZ/AtpI family protein [Pseudomonadota bacterium]